MFVGKPTRKPGTFAPLDGGDNSTDVENLAALPGSSLLNGIDNMPFNNPDAAAGQLYAKPSVMQGNPQGAIRTGTSSGSGMLQKTAVTSAPKMKPAAPTANTVSTMPSSIVK